MVEFQPSSAKLLRAKPCNICRRRGTDSSGLGHPCTPAWQSFAATTSLCYILPVFDMVVSEYQHIHIYRVYIHIWYKAHSELWSRT